MKWFLVSECYLGDLFLQKNNYFDLNAEAYDENMQRQFYWRMLKKQEMIAFLKVSGDISGTNILDLGSGTGSYCELYLKKGAMVTAVDSSCAMTKVLKQKKIKFYSSSIENLRLNKTFEILTAMGSFEFLEDMRLGFETVALHLRPGGKFFLMYPRAGFIGRLYQAIHRLWGCPTYHNSHNDILKIADYFGLRLDGVKSGGLINNIFIFTKK